MQDGHRADRGTPIRETPPGLTERRSRSAFSDAKSRSAATEAARTEISSLPSFSRPAETRSGVKPGGGTTAGDAHVLEALHLIRGRCGAGRDLDLSGVAPDRVTSAFSSARQVSSVSARRKEAVTESRRARAAAFVCPPITIGTRPFTGFGFDSTSPHL